MINKRLALTAVLASLAVVFGYMEALIPAIIPIPGIKPGIANVVVLFALYRLDKKYAFGIMLLKVGISAMLFSGFTAFLYSAAGGLVSFFAMTVLKGKISVELVSVAGGISHNIGQLAAACAVLGDFAVLVYTPYLLAGGTVSGLLIGILCRFLLHRVPKK